jgi:hypothetical protein
LAVVGGGSEFKNLRRHVFSSAARPSTDSNLEPLSRVEEEIWDRPSWGLFPPRPSFCSEDGAAVESAWPFACSNA